MPTLQDRHWAQRAIALAGARKASVAHRGHATAQPTLVSTPPPGEDWLHSWKFDGYRLQATASDGKVRLWSRQAIEWTDRLAPIVRSIEQLGLRSAILDGELIAGGGRQADFNVLQETIAAHETAGLSYVAFDLLNVAGVDITAAPTIARRALLADLVGSVDGAPSRLLFSNHVVGHADKVLALSLREGFEGIVSKKVSAAYPVGRTRVWVKAKNPGTELLLVVGLSEEHLVLAQPDAGGWRYAGRVRRHGALSIPKSFPVHKGPSRMIELQPHQARRSQNVDWLEQPLVVEVDHRASRGGDGFRHTRLLRVITDCSAADLLHRRR